MSLSDCLLALTQSFTTPILYSDLNIDGWGAPGLLLRTLTARPSLCHLVKSLMLSTGGANAALLRMAWPSLLLAHILLSDLGDRSLDFLINMPGLVRLNLGTQYGVSVPLSVVPAGALNNLRILALSDAVLDSEIFQIMATLPAGQGPLRLTTLDLSWWDGSAEPAPHLLAFLRRYGASLLHLSMQAAPPFNLASLCPALVSIQLDFGQTIPFFASSSHSNLSLVKLDFSWNSADQVLDELVLVLDMVEDRTKFPRLSALDISTPDLFDVVLSQDDLDCWEDFAQACGRAGLILFGCDGLNWEEISRELQLPCVWVYIV